MSEVMVRHPEGWIGVPEDWPNDTWQSAEDWGAELVGVLEEDFGEPEPEQRAALRTFLIAFAQNRRDRGSTRGYVSVDGWAGPIYLADLVLTHRSSVGDTTLEQMAGADDPEAIEKPIIDPFVTNSGLAGLYSVRYLNPPEVGGLVVRADYVWPMEDGFIQLYTSQLDLVAFERVLPRLEALAKTVSVVDGSDHGMTSR